MEIVGYDKLNGGNDGLRYAWKCKEADNYIESAAFINRTKGIDGSISAYTTSVSAGCILKARGIPCKFCRTGTVLPFSRKLTHEEIALQNVFMVLNDMNNPYRREIAEKEREFAYMGQGEPGFSYDQVRLAVELTNRIMKSLNQKVHRHIIATSGVPDAINAYKKDVKEYYTERVTIHLSMHSLQDRDAIMPINTIYPLKESINAIDDILEITGEKPCLGILLFNCFKPNHSDISYTNGLEQVKEMLNILDPNKVRLSFCEYNPCEDVGVTHEFDKNSADSIMKYAAEQGFEAKLFFSFGKNENTACGLLGGTEPAFQASEDMSRLYDRAKALINEFK